jgi:hypothetical protein
MVDWTMTVNVSVILCPAAMLRLDHVMSEPFRTPPLEEAMYVTCEGRTSVTVTFVAFTVEVFVTVMV